MSLSDLAALGSLVSGVAVLVSLILLYFQLRQLNRQVRQAERNQQGALRQGRALGLMEWNLHVSDAEISDVLTRLAAGQARTRAELEQYVAVARAGFQLYEDSFDQYKAGLMSERAFASFERNAAASFAVPGFRVAWTAIRPMFGPEFVSHMDRIRAETPVNVGPDALALWNAAIAAELAAAGRGDSEAE